MDGLPRGDVHDRDAVAALGGRAAVVGREGEPAVVGDGRLVRVLPRGGDAAEHLAAGRVDDRHRVLALVQDEQRRPPRLLHKAAVQARPPSRTSQVNVLIVGPPGRMVGRPPSTAPRAIAVVSYLNRRPRPIRRRIVEIAPGMALGDRPAAPLSEAARPAASGTDGAAAGRAP